MLNGDNIVPTKNRYGSNAKQGHVGLESVGRNSGMWTKGA